MKQGKTSEKIYQRLRTTGSQPTRLYGLAKVHKSCTPLWPDLSIPGSSYENLNIFLSPFFERLPGANIETSSKDARAALEAIKLNEVELVVSLDVKSLYTNVPVEGAIEIALKELYSSDEISEIPRSAMKSLLRLAICSYCAEKVSKENTQELKLFKRYVDDIVYIVKKNPLDYLEYAKSLHKDLYFTLETPNDSGDQAFLDLNIKSKRR
ncbi:uncharacterized protein LOC142340502 [Convolutriloba macropyga]|uniref:uncharacterized protein LOC142340502 n=1 Tax=Convolutriloba macropyga TaxID=536237 RepID=UPI003F523BBA